MSRNYDWQLFVTPGLGDNSYLVYSGEEAVIVDPQRDAWRFLAEADAKKLRIRFVLETHVHNDYLSGALEIQNSTRAEIAAPAKGNYKFPHKRMAEGDEISLGALRLVAIETPGHTPEHISWLMYQDGLKEPVAIFSGGSLLVGSAGRTDLLGPQWTDDLTRKQFHTIQRLSALPRSISLLPTHGAGSFCTASGSGAERTSTLKKEFDDNPALKHREEASFVQNQLSNLSSYPTYYAYMAPINRQGPAILRTPPESRALSASEVASHIESDVWLIDARDRKAFAEAHIPGSLNIELTDSFASYVGWLIPFGAPFILVLPDDELIVEAITQLLRIGYDNLIGHLRGGFESWQTAGNKTSAYPTGSIDDLCRDYQSGNRNLIDVRQQEEWNSGHAKGSIHAFVGDLPKSVAALPQDQQMWVGCASGYRAAIAASYLDRNGIPVRLLVEEGIPELLKNCPEATSDSNSH